MFVLLKISLFDFSAEPAAEKIFLSQSRDDELFCRRNRALASEILNSLSLTKILINFLESWQWWTKYNDIPDYFG